MGEIARKDYECFFVCKERKNGEKFYHIVEDSPNELGVLIYDIHKALSADIPSDWIYKVIMHAFDDLKNDKLEDITIESDIYTGELIDWVAHNTWAIEYCDEALSGDARLERFTGIIESAQHNVKQLIYGYVDNFIQDDEEEKENDE